MLDVNRLRVIDAVARHGSVTAAAKELHYSQPSVTHHLARLEAETGAQLLQRVGRGIRLTPAGQLLADRAAEIIGRIDAADAELSAHVGLTAGRVRLAGFSSAIGSLVPRAVAALASEHPGPGDQRSPTRIRPRRSSCCAPGKIDVALIFRYDETEPEPRRRPPAPPARRSGVPALARRGGRKLAALRDATWIAGCERCRSHLLSLCADAGLRAADRLQLRRHGGDAGAGGRRTGRDDASRAWPCAPTAPRASSRRELPGSPRHVYAATYGEPPDPPATAALLAALETACRS